MYRNTVMIRTIQSTDRIVKKNGGENDILLFERNTDICYLNKITKRSHRRPLPRPRTAGPPRDVGP